MDSFINKHYQGVTPLMYACSTGLADCVKMLAEKRADFNKLDNHGRVCLQLARRAQGDNQNMASWLKDNVQGIDSSNITANGCVGVRGCVWAGASGCGCVLVSVGVGVGVDVCGCRSSSWSCSGSWFGCGCGCVGG